MRTIDIDTICQRHSAQKVRNLFFTIACHADANGVWETSRNEIINLCGMSEWDVRSGLRDLVDSQTILQQTSNKSTIITLCNIDSYTTSQEVSSPAPLQQISNKDTSIQEAADRIYDRYPTKCVVSGRSTGKSRKKDLATIIRLLKKGEYTEETLASVIDRYINDCKQHSSYIKNFSTFLNNIPDYDNADALDIFSSPAEQPSKSTNWQ